MAEQKSTLKQSNRSARLPSKPKYSAEELLLKHREEFSGEINQILFFIYNANPLEKYLCHVNKLALIL
jgi:hypothetical protein